MSNGAMIFMGLSWAVVIVLNIFCFLKVFKSEK